jgi:hypothetical protein
MKNRRMGDVRANISIRPSFNICLQRYRYAKLLGTKMVIGRLSLWTDLFMINMVFFTEIFTEKKTLPITNVPARAHENASPMPTVIQD